MRSSIRFIVQEMFPYFLYRPIAYCAVGYQGAFILFSDIQIGRSLYSLRANCVFLIFNARFAWLVARGQHFDLKADCRKGRRTDRKESVVADYRISKEKRAEEFIG